MESELSTFAPLLVDADVTSFHVTLANHSSLEDTIHPDQPPVLQRAGLFPEILR